MGFRWDRGFTGHAPSDDVYVCANYQTCETAPVPIGDLDPREMPVCDEDLPMTTQIKMRDWPHRWKVA